MTGLSIPKWSCRAWLTEMSYSSHPRSPLFQDRDNSTLRSPFNLSRQVANGSATLTLCPGSPQGTEFTRPGYIVGGQGGIFHTYEMPMPTMNRSIRFEPYTLFPAGGNTHYICHFSPQMTIAKWRKYLIEVDHFSAVKWLSLLGKWLKSILYDSVVFQMHEEIGKSFPYRNFLEEGWQPLPGRRGAARTIMRRTLYHFN